MPIANDWDINYNDKELRHIDGILAYDGPGTGTQPSVGEYIIGTTSGAVGKVIARTGDVAKGTLTLTNVVGLFVDNEPLFIQSELPFDDITAASPRGFKVGDTLVGASSTSTLAVKAIEFNASGNGAGVAYGRPMSAVFTSGEQLDIQGGKTDVADVVVGQTGTDKDILWTGATADGAMMVPGTKLPVLTSTQYGTLQFVAATSKIIRTTGSWITDGYNVAATWVFVSGAATAANNGRKTVVSVTATDMIVNETLTDEVASATETVNGMTAKVNASVIIHYDAGSVAVPEDAKIADTTGATGAVGYAQRVYGSTATGSIRLVDSNTNNGSWTDDATLYLQDVCFYKALVAGKVFSVGDVIKGGTSSVTGCVLQVIDDGDNTGKLVLARKSAGTFTVDEEIQKKVAGVWTKYAEGEAVTNYLAAATVNIVSGIRTTQRASQGGLFPTASVNIVRSSNAFYTYVMDTIDEILQLDDKVPVKANVKEQLYTLTNGWRIPDLSFRFVEKGSWRDADNNNIWTDYQSQGTVADIGNHGFYYSTSNPTPQPNFYIEQDGSVLRQDWLEGHVDVNVKVKTSTDPRYINPAVAALGQLINGGTATWFAGEYLRTYSHAQLSAVGGLAVVSLGTERDLNNTTGTHQMTYTGAGGFTVGEEIVGGTSGAIGIVTVDETVGNNLQYVLKTTAQFHDGGAETITGQVSGATCTSAAPTNLVAGYGTNIRIMTVDRYFTGGTAPSGAFVYGENCTQAGSSWEGYYMSFDSATDRMYFQDSNANAPGAGIITGSVSTKTYDPASDSTSTVVKYDLGDGSGWEEYTAAIAANITDASPQGIWECYEWAKYVTRKESLLIQGGPGSTVAGVQGRIYRSLNTDWAEVVVSPWGSFAGAGGVGKMFGARGVFIIKESLDSADIQNFYVLNNAGTTRTPPNLQTILISVPEAGVRAAAYRTAVEGSTTIQRTEFKVGAVGGGYNQAGDSAVKIAAQDRAVSPIPADVPDAGAIRVLSPNGTGNYIYMTYSAVNRASNYFTLTGTIGSFLIAAGEASADLTLNDNTHVCLIEKESSGTTVTNTIQYIGTIYVYWVSRKKGYLPAEGTTSFTGTGASIASNMQADDIVNLP